MTEAEVLYIVSPVLIAVAFFVGWARGYKAAIHYAMEKLDEMAGSR